MNRVRFFPRHGFTYIELLAVLGIAAILLAIFVPYLESLREKDHRVRCAENLRQLRDALQHYAADNHHDYPSVMYDPAANRDGYRAFTGPDAADPFAIVRLLEPATRPAAATLPTSLPALVAPLNGAPLNIAGMVQPNDVTASLWLLVRGGYVSDLHLFICPSTSNVADTLSDERGNPVVANRRSNFRRAENLSYSYASPFSGYSGYYLNSDALPGGFALMADRNPGVAAGSDVTKPAHTAPALELAQANSTNHGRAGENVLYADGSVAFQSTPYCGVGRDSDKHTDGDNIYTALATAPLLPGVSPTHTGNGYCGRQYGPVYQYDSYLVPTAEDGR